LNWRRAAIEAQGHSELGAFGTGGRNRAVKTNRLVTEYVAFSALVLLVG